MNDNKLYGNYNLYTKPSWIKKKEFDNLIKKRKNGKI